MWSDDAIRDAMVSGHVSELSGLEELERRHGSKLIDVNSLYPQGFIDYPEKFLAAHSVPTPLELFGR